MLTLGAISRRLAKAFGGGGTHRRYRGGRDRRGHGPFQCRLVHHNQRSVEPVRSNDLEIRDRAAHFVDKAYGIELVDVDIRRLSLPELNKEHVFDRMKAERGRIAKEQRSVGEMEAKRIIAEADHQRADIAAEAYAKAQQLKAEGDAEAARTYAAAFSRDSRFYKFLRTLQAYQQFLDDKTTLFLPADAAAAKILRYQLQRPRSDMAPTVTNRPVEPSAPPANPQAAKSSLASP